MDVGNLVQVILSGVVSIHFLAALLLIPLKSGALDH